MIKWDDATTILKKLGNDESSSGVTFMQMMANQGYKLVLNKLNAETIEEERSTTLVADRRDYQLPVDATWLSNLVVSSGDTKYPPLKEVKSRDTWDRITSNPVTGIPELYYIQPRKGVGGGKISLNPIPGSAYTMKMVFEVTAKDLGSTAYSTGTASVSRNTVTVTGVGTVWTANMKGRYVRFNGANGDGLWYKIATVTPGTTLTLEQYYQGPSNISAESYEIAELFELPEDVHMAPLYYALWHHWSTKRDKVQAKLYQNLYETLTDESHEMHATKSRDSILEEFDIESFLTDYPAYFPADGITE